MTKPTAFRSEGVEHGFGISPSSPVHGKVHKMTESGVIKEMACFPHHCNNYFPNTCKYTVYSSEFIAKNNVSQGHSSF